MREFAILYAIGFVQLALFVAVSFALARWLGAHVEAAAVGTPSLLVLRRATPRITLGPVPFGSMSIAGMANMRGEPSTEPSTDPWHALPLRARLVVILGPWVALAAVVAALLGPVRAARSIGRGVAQLLFTADLEPLVAHALQLLRDGSLVAVTGVVLAKLVALNLLPIGGFGGAAALREIVWRKQRGVPRWFERWVAVSLLLSLIWFGVRPLWAVIQAMRHGY